MSYLPSPEPETSSEDSDEFEYPHVYTSEYPVEDHISYDIGGFHPVHLGDLYDNGRYRVVHKIWAGDVSTIWLARDSALRAWVALKIVKADYSSQVEENTIKCHNMLSQREDIRFVTYIRYFHIDGPNGHHLCLVLPFCGPSLDTLSGSSFWPSRITPRWVRALAFQTAEILRDLHSRGLCHGNIRPSNFLLRIRNLDHLDDNGIYHLFGQPRIGQVRTRTGRIPGPQAPRYIVGFLDFMSSGEDILQNEICLVGFDEASDASSSPNAIDTHPGFLGPAFLAPEVAMGEQPSQASNVWALGVTVLTLRAGSPSFLGGGHPASVADTITAAIKYFGQLPTSWEEPLYNRDGRPTSDKNQGKSRKTCTQIRSLKQLISNIWDKPADDLNESEETPAQPFIVRDDDTYPRNYDWFGDDLSTVISYDPKDLEWLNDIHDNTRRPYPEHYAERFWKPSAIKINGRFLPTYLTQQHWELLPFLPKIPRQEVDLLHDMLTKVFMYGPEERISAEDIMGHPWFRMNEGEALHKEKAPILSRMFNT